MPRVAYPRAVSAPQNIYDDAAFFAGYARLPRFGEGWTGAFEHAAFMSLLPPAAGLRVLDLGCGAGQLAHHLAAAGAARVVAADLSARMLAEARRHSAHPRVDFLRAAIERLAFAPASFDLVVSSLAVHYVGDWGRLCPELAAWIAPGGHVVYSTEHPVYLSRATEAGWLEPSPAATSAWALTRYGDEGERTERWIVEGVRKYHRMVSTQLNGLIDAGFAIERVLEPMPTPAMLEARPEWAIEANRPFALLVRARRLPG